MPFNSFVVLGERIEPAGKAGSRPKNSGRDSGPVEYFGCQARLRKHDLPPGSCESTSLGGAQANRTARFFPFKTIPPKDGGYLGTKMSKNLKPKQSYSIRGRFG